MGVPPETHSFLSCLCSNSQASSWSISWMGWVHSYGTGVACWQRSLASSALKAIGVSCSTAVAGGLFQSPMVRTGLPHRGRWRAYGSEFIPMVRSCPCVCFLQPNEVRCYPHVAFNNFEHKGQSQVSSTVFKFIPFKIFHHGSDTGCGVIVALNKAYCFPLDFLEAVYILGKMGIPYSSSIF